MFFSKIKYFTFQRDANGTKELLVVDRTLMIDFPMKYKVPLILLLRVTLLLKRNNYDVEVITEMLRDALYCPSALNCVSAWDMLV